MRRLTTRSWSRLLPRVDKPRFSPDATEIHLLASAVLIVDHGYLYQFVNGEWFRTHLEFAQEPPPPVTP